MLAFLPILLDIGEENGFFPCLCEPFSDVLENFPEGTVREYRPLRRKARYTGHHHEIVDHHNPVQGSFFSLMPFLFDTGIIRIIPAHYFPRRLFRISRQEFRKMSMLNWVADTSTFVFCQVPERQDLQPR
jgi:hypothetical protein